MKATREQCLAMAKEAKIDEWHGTDDPAFLKALKTLVHLAQQFTLDQLMAQKAFAYASKDADCTDCITWFETEENYVALHAIPETLE